MKSKRIISVLLTAILLGVSLFAFPIGAQAATAQEALDLYATAVAKLQSANETLPRLATRQFGDWRGSESALQLMDIKTPFGIFGEEFSWWWYQDGKREMETKADNSFINPTLQVTDIISQNIVTSNDVTTLEICVTNNATECPISDVFWFGDVGFTTRNYVYGLFPLAVSMNADQSADYTGDTIITATLDEQGNFITLRQSYSAVVRYENINAKIGLHKYSADWVETDCDVTIDYYTGTTAEHEHILGQWYWVSEPTLFEKGADECHCIVCGEYTEVRETKIESFYDFFFALYATFENLWNGFLNLFGR